MSKILLSLGSNKGNRAKYIADAIAHCTKTVGKLLLKAPLYETAAWGNTNQNSFLNTVICLETVLSPKMVFKAIKAIEILLKRSNSEHWGPREIDIDIILFEQLIVHSETLTIPHASMHLRNFVLQPAADICPHWNHPVFNKTIGNLLEECPDTLEVLLWKR